MHRNAQAPCVGLQAGLASGPKALLDGMPCVLPTKHPPMPVVPPTSCYVNQTVGPYLSRLLSSGA